MESEKIAIEIQKRDESGSVAYIPEIHEWCGDKYCPYALPACNTETEALTRVILELIKLHNENPHAEIEFYGIDYVVV